MKLEKGSCDSAEMQWPGVFLNGYENNKFVSFLTQLLLLKFGNSLSETDSDDMNGGARILVKLP